MDVVRPFCFEQKKAAHGGICYDDSSWVKKVLSMAMTHMSLGSLQGAASSATLVAGVSLFPTLLASDWARVSLQLDTIFQHICYPQKLRLHLAHNVFPHVWRGCPT